jgi:hypothetical protein
MTIDRIGKGSGVTPADGGAATGAASAKKTFSVDGPSGVGAAEAASPADAVRAGKMDVSAYVDLRVEEATRHLEGKLAPSDLDSIRSMLRAQIADDPAVRELVKAATGAFPPSGDEA